MPSRHLGSHVNISGGLRWVLLQCSGHSSLIAGGRGGGQWTQNNENCEAFLVVKDECVFRRVHICWRLTQDF